jgi:hypothetical protein
MSLSSSLNRRKNKKFHVHGKDFGNANYILDHKSYTHSLTPFFMNGSLWGNVLLTFRYLVSKMKLLSWV